MRQPPSGTMFVYRLTEPVDDFDELIPLPDWIAADPAERTRWALQAVLALADAEAEAGTEVDWDGTMRHLPSVGAVLAPPEAIPYLVVKQDNDGITFVISGRELPWHAGIVERATRVRARAIGAWTAHRPRQSVPTGTRQSPDHQSPALRRAGPHRRPVARTGLSRRRPDRHCRSRRDNAVTRADELFGPRARTGDQPALG
jgi:hypothetical protein